MTARAFTIAIATASLSILPLRELARAEPLVSGGGQAACALLPDRTVSCWGSGGTGQIGDGGTSDQSLPIAVSGLLNVTQLSSGYAFACAVSEAKAYCWGDNSTGNLGDGTTHQRNTPVAVANLDGVAEIAAGGWHSCAVKKDGAVWCWGSNEFGQLGDGTTTAQPLPTQVAGIDSAVQVVAAYTHSCALLADRTVRCWGGEREQLGSEEGGDGKSPLAVSGITNAVAISARGHFTCALLETGSIRCWGENMYGTIGDGSTSSASTPRAVSGITGALQVSAGADHACAILADRTMACWGYGGYGNLGDGATSNRSSPVSVAGVSNVVEISAGGSAVYARLANGTVKAWGNDWWGQLGDGVLVFGRNVANPVDVQIGALKPPAPITLSAPPALTSSRTVSIAWVAERDTNYSCAVDGNEPAACSSPLLLTDLQDGDHSVSITGTSATVDSDPTRVDWSIDATAPLAPVIGSKPPVLANSRAASFSFTGEPAASFTCSLDGLSFAPCSPGKSYADLSKGPHTFSVRQFDRAGNAGPAASHAWTVDVTAPSPPVLSGVPPSFTNLKSASIAFTAMTDRSFKCSVDGAPFTSCSSPKRISGLQEGAHSIEVRHSDAAGNSSSSKATWLVDTTPLSLSRSAAGSRIKSKSQTSYLLAVRSDASGPAKAEYTTSSKAPSLNAKNVATRTVSFTSPVNFKTASTIRWLRLQDRAGNWSAWFIG